MTHGATLLSGTVPVHALAPLEYRYALDAAMTMLTQAPAYTVRVCCNVPPLEGEVSQRLVPNTREQGHAALWLEPMVDDWRGQFRTLVKGLPVGAPLIILLSLPLARCVTERRTWAGRPVGMNPLATWKLYRALAGAGFELKGVYGFHSLASIVLNLIGQLLDRRNRPDVADRFHFAGRLRYGTAGALLPFSTVALVVVSKCTSRTQT
jgi:hypothetical protein